MPEVPRSVTDLIEFMAELPESVTESIRAVTTLISAMPAFGDAVSTPWTGTGHPVVPLVKNQDNGSEQGEK